MPGVGEQDQNLVAMGKAQDRARALVQHVAIQGIRLQQRHIGFQGLARRADLVQVFFRSLDVRGQMNLGDQAAVALDGVIGEVD